MTEPHASTAETSALGAILRAGLVSSEDAAVVAKKVFEVAPPEAFWRPAAQIIATRIEALLRLGQPVDPESLLAALKQHGELTRVGGGSALADLWERGWDISNAELYARDIRDAWGRRRSMEHATRALQILGSPEADASLAWHELAAGADVFEDLRKTERPIVPRSVGELLLDPRDEPTWLAPGLIAERERVMMTGVSGGGKTELLMMLGVCLALGMNPFTALPTETGPVRVLHVDAENERDELRPRYRSIIRTAESRLGGDAWNRDNLWFEDRTEGLELAQGDDLGWLDRLMSGSQPQLLIVGPLSKLTRGDLDKSAQAAIALTSALDGLRVRHNCAVLIEAHAGHTRDPVTGERELRPRGSSYLLSWPNVGLGMRPHRTSNGYPPELVELERWRGMRTSREWPVALRLGTGSGMPWVPMPADQFEMIDEQSKKPQGRNRRS